MNWYITLSSEDEYLLTQCLSIEDWIESNLEMLREFEGYKFLLNAITGEILFKTNDFVEYDNYYSDLWEKKISGLCFAHVNAIEHLRPLNWRGFFFDYSSDFVEEKFNLEQWFEEHQAFIDEYPNHYIFVEHGSQEVRIKELLPTKFNKLLEDVKIVKPYIEGTTFHTKLFSKRKRESAFAEWNKLAVTKS